MKKNVKSCLTRKIIPEHGCSHWEWIMTLVWEIALSCSFPQSHDSLAVCKKTCWPSSPVSTCLVSICMLMLIWHCSLYIFISRKVLTHICFDYFKSATLLWGRMENTKAGCYTCNNIKYSKGNTGHCICTWSKPYRPAQGEPANWISPFSFNKVREFLPFKSHKTHAYVPSQAIILLSDLYHFLFMLLIRCNMLILKLEVEQTQGNVYTTNLTCKHMSRCSEKERL